MIDTFADNGGCDGAVEYSQHIPVKMIAHMLGVKDADEDKFRDWVHGVFQTGITDDMALQTALSEMTEYFRAQLPERRQNPGDDLVSVLLAGRYEDGRPFTENHVLGSLRVLLLGGIDTTWSAIGSTLWHFATHDEDRRRIAREPSLAADRDRGDAARLFASFDDAGSGQGCDSRRLPITRPGRRCCSLSRLRTAIRLSSPTPTK